VLVEGAARGDDAQSHGVTGMVAEMFNDSPVRRRAVN
jgi:hypothetical protein